jgi:diamine N-acetyltransferase
LEPSDLDVMYGWENDTDVWRVSGTLAPFSRHVLSRLIEEQQFDIYATRQLRLVVESCEGEAVGAVDLFELDPQNLRAGVGVIISPEYRHRGYGLDALNTLEGYARKVLRLNQLWCSVTEDNLSSQQLFLRAGYTECGRRRQWILTADGALDEILYQKILQ